jgi:GT2 family glycosyltransferase
MWGETEPADRLIANLSLGTVTGPASTAFYPRHDLALADAVGFVCIFSAPRPPRAALESISIPALRVELSARGAQVETHTALGAAAARAIHLGLDGRRHPLVEHLPRQTYGGRDTLADICPEVRLEFDSVVRVPPAGLLLTGWLHDPHGSVGSMRIRGGHTASPLDPEHWISVSRPDVAEALGAQFGASSVKVGFVAFAPGAAAASNPYVEVETATGDLAFRALRPVERPTLAFIKSVLSAARSPSSEVERAVAEVLAPAVVGLNRARLARPRRDVLLRYGDPPAEPATSLVVTLFGRVDFLEYQLALFSERPDTACEIVYVLDDPRFRDDAERLAESAWRRFRVPFLLLTLSENTGFAPANNAGLRQARGRFACLLNSDVFPLAAEGMDWVARLAAHLSEDESVGVVAPLLLYEDGTVQHAGMQLRRLPGFPAWEFPIHPGKGAAPDVSSEPFSTEAVTGACMMLRRKEVLDAGGLDERYLIGDFEDSDLCRKLATCGQRSIVDPSIRLLHLERQSQGESEPWRKNATFVNAFLHHEKWSR